MAFILTSAAFKDGAPIPGKYTCDGVDVSPPLTWSGAPAGTRSVALIADDPDAPGGTWVHWVLYNLPAAGPRPPLLLQAVRARHAAGAQGRSSEEGCGGGIGGTRARLGTDHGDVREAEAMRVPLPLAAIWAVSLGAPPAPTLSVVVLPADLRGLMSALWVEK